jgi:hypothetical protein
VKLGLSPLVNKLWISEKTVLRGTDGLNEERRRNRRLEEIMCNEVSGSRMTQDRKSLLADLSTPTSHLEDPGFDFRYEELLSWRRT